MTLEEYARLRPTPIETEYNGYRFRSRLEARWAVFFDAVGIKYEYEPEGYNLPNGTRYLPDFYLPDFNIFAEVKASRDKDDGKARDFALASSGFDEDAICGGVLICYGQPYDRDMRFISACESDDDGGGEYDTDWGPPGSVHFAECYYHTDCIAIVIEDHKPRSFFWCRLVDTYDGRPQDLITDNIYQAELKARQARFEHGEKP